MSSLRRFTSLCIGFSFLIMSYTGVILFLSPKGRVANWTNWQFLGFDKTQYANLHVTFMVLFLVGVLIHIYLNWIPLFNYLKNKTKAFSLLTKEFLLALGINGLFVIGTLYYWTPFEQFLDFQEALKGSWEQRVDQAPYAHAELSTLEEFAMRTHKNLDTIVAPLNASKLRGVESNKTIADIAKDNNLSPARLFEIINHKPSTTPLKEGGGYGKLSLRAAADMYAFSLESSLHVIQAKGFNANENSTLKEIADALHVKPIELLELLKTPQ